MIDVAFLIAAGCGPAQARQYAIHLDAAAARFAITTPRRVAAFVAQCLIESANLVTVEENLWYTTPQRAADVWPSRFKTAADAMPYMRNPQALANRVYAGKLGNGNEASGDGWRYRGRGLKQLTGKTNYAAATLALDVDYLSAPDLVAKPEHAAQTAAWFFASTGCNELADAGNWDAITRKVNGPAMLQQADRRSLTRRTLAAIDPTETVRLA